MTYTLPERMHPSAMDLYPAHPRLVHYHIFKDAGQPFHDVALRYDWKDYLQWMLDEQPGSVVIRDYQVIHLSDASWRSEHILDARADPADLDQACTLLTRWGMVGIVEQYVRSAALYQQLYAPLIPGFRFNVHASNRTSDRSEQESFHQELEQLCDATGQELHAAFCRANALDLALYEHGCRILQQAEQRLLSAEQASDQTAS